MSFSNIAYTRAVKLGLILAIAGEALGFRVTTIAAYLKDARE
jgi:hypothetical protein